LRTHWCGLLDVRYAPIATKFCIAAKCRDVPIGCIRPSNNLRRDRVKPCKVVALRGRDTSHHLTGDDVMRRRTIQVGSAMAAAGLTLMTGLAFAQQATDIDAIKAANTAFYAALSARDAKAMEGLWANKPYVINIGPVSKSIAVGYEDAVSKYFANNFNNVFSEVNASMTSTAQVQTDGKLAWVVGTENAKLTFKTGEVREFVTFTTNIYEKEGNRWLMVSHQAAMQPK
jgi:ketosteroid isomerase-like protein